MLERTCVVAERRVRHVREPPHADDPPGVRIRQRPEQHAVDDADVAVLAPIPSARMVTTTAANPGFRRNPRAACRTSPARSSSQRQPHTSRVRSRMRIALPTEPLAKLRGLRLGAVPNAAGEHPIWPRSPTGRTGGTRRGGSRVSRRVLDRALGHRWVTDARRAPRGICRRDTGYVTRRTSWSAVSASTPNMQWHITFGAPRTRTWRPPNSSLRRPLTRSPAVRS